MPDTIVIQRATLDDVARITEHRRLMFLEEQTNTPARIEASLTPFVQWLTDTLRAERYIGLLALDGSTLAASAGLWRMPWPPGPLNLIEERAYILNVYTDPAYRRRGLARQLVSRLMDEATALGLNIVELHASKAGRPVYEALGFTTTNQMRVIPS